MLQTELHRHLDISLRAETLYSLAKEKDLLHPLGSLEEFRRRVNLSHPLANLNAVIEKFEIYQRVLINEEIIERMAAEVSEDCYQEGTRQVELRFSPAFLCRQSGISWETALRAVERGIARTQEVRRDLKVGLICIITREFSGREVDHTVDFFVRNASSFVALDLAGSESGYPCRNYEQAFRRAKRELDRQGRELKVTIHAGEDAGPENMWEAIRLLGARRIGHGIRAVGDPALLDYLAKEEICLEVCPTSNWLTQAVPRLEEHPLPKLLAAGVPVSINTDDPGVFAVTLPSELAVCRDRMGLSEADILRCLNNAQRYTFIE